MDHWWKGGWVGVGLGLGKEDQDSKKIKRMRKTLHHRRVGSAANQGWAKRIKILTA